MIEICVIYIYISYCTVNINKLYYFTLAAEPRIRSSKMEEISAERRLLDTWNLEEGIARRHLTYNVKLKHIVITYCKNILPIYLLHNLILFCLCNLSQRAKFVTYVSTVTKFR